MGVHEVAAVQVIVQMAKTAVVHHIKWDSWQDRISVETAATVGYRWYASSLKVKGQ